MTDKVLTTVPPEPEKELETVPPEPEPEKELETVPPEPEKGNE